MVERILGAHGLRVFDVEELPTHGGSLRVYACHEAAAHAATAALERLRAREAEAGLDLVETYAGFGPRVTAIQRALREFLNTAQAEGKTVAAYGAAAKGNTLLNSSGVGADSILFVADRNPHKQGKFLPGSHIPIRAPEAIFAARPDYLLILPWNLEQEIRQEMAGISEWGGRFVVPIPELRIVD